jgi:hypothetical protein
MTRDHEAEVAEQVAMTMRADRLLDAIVDGRAWTLHDELVFMLDGPFGVDWRAGRGPQQAPPAAWEPIVLELGEAVAVAFHLDPLWADDPADVA